MKYTAILLASAICLGTLNAAVGDTIKVNPYKQTLSGVPAPELPAKAASLVKGAKVREWGNTTVSVVKAALEGNPASAPAVVSAIAKAVPEMASIAAGTAAEAQPAQAADVARAAALAAPKMTSRIVTAVCRAVPGEFKHVARAVAEAIPGSNKEVLLGVAVALPQLRDSIEKSLNSLGSTDQPVIADILDQAAALAGVSTSADDLARGPHVTGTRGNNFPPPNTIIPQNTIPVPPGYKRPYSAP